MTLPYGQISIGQISNEFYNATVNGVYYGVDANLYNLNWYRGKYYYSAPTNGTIYQFPTGTISFANFLGTGSNCACDCACDCACACGNGSN